MECRHDIKKDLLQEIRTSHLHVMCPTSWESCTSTHVHDCNHPQYRMDKQLHDYRVCRAVDVHDVVHLSRALGHLGAAGGRATDALRVPLTHPQEERRAYHGAKAHRSPPMPSRKRSSPQGRSERGPWLPSDERARSRPWAYEELLFGPSDDREQIRELGALVEELDNERGELARLYQGLDAHLSRISSLESRLRELTPAEGDDPGSAQLSKLPRTRAAPADTGDSGAISAELSYALARCEGFEVDAPTGQLGFVEGLRFLSRIDQPDLLEVRGGRFGRQLLLIPVEQVEEVRVAEELVIVRSALTPAGDLLAELADRFRRALHVDPAA